MVREEGGSLNCEKYVLWEGYQGNAVFLWGRGKEFFGFSGIWVGVNLDFDDDTRDIIRINELVNL